MFARNKLFTSAVIFSLALAGVARARDPDAPPVSMPQVRDAARALTAEIGHLVEDMQIELRRVPNAEHLLNDARDTAESAEHLTASLDQGVDLGHAAKVFQKFDKAWHHLSAQLNRMAGTSRALRRGVVRVVQVDAALHRLLGGPGPVDVQEVRRLAESLAPSAQHLLEDVQTDLNTREKTLPHWTTPGSNYRMV